MGDYIGKDFAKKRVMKYLSILLALIFSTNFHSQALSNISTNETLTYRIHYGILNAGEATLSTSYSHYNGSPHLHVVGQGRSKGAVNAFFKVRDYYESYISLQTGLPSFYVRNVHEGNYRQHLETTFHHSSTSLTLKNVLENNSTKNIKSVKGVQDMISAFYHLRSMPAQDLKVGSVRNMNVWIDDELFPFQIRVVGTETISTKFGKINCLKIIPLVKSGRVFKEKEGVTIWVSNDKNHVPIAISAKLLVGALRADLSNHVNVKYPLNFTK